MASKPFGSELISNLDVVQLLRGIHEAQDSNLELVVVHYPGAGHVR